MKEETGINILDKRVNIHYLGWNYANKSSTKLWWFYGIDLTKLNLDLNANYKGSSDGSVGEQKLRAKFVLLKYEICNQKKLKKNINDDLFRIYYRDEKIAIIEATEINFDINTRKKLEKLRNFLEQKEWGIYFFELQKLMHEQIIKFLKWENKSLNYNSYINFLNEKLNNHLNDSNIIKNFNQVINQINYYRNLLSKATSNIINNTVEWNNLNGLSQKVIAWDLYYQINNFINVINLFLELK